MSKEIERTSDEKDLSCTLTDAEKIKAGKALVEFLHQIGTKEDELKRIQGRYKVEISDLQVKADYQAELVESGVEMRLTKVDTVKNFKKGTVTLIRMDTMEIVDERAMTPEEGQKEIPLEDEKKPKAKKEKVVKPEEVKHPDGEDEYAVWKGEKSPIAMKVIDKDSLLNDPETKYIFVIAKSEKDAIAKAIAKEQEGVQTAPPAPPAEPPAPVTDEECEAAMGHINDAHRASVSTIQRRMRLTSNKAQRIMDALEAKGWVGPVTDEGGVREILRKEPF